MTCSSVIQSGLHNWHEGDGSCWDCDVVATHLVDDLTLQAMSDTQMNNASVLAVTQ